MNDVVTESADGERTKSLFSHWVLWESCIVAWKNIYVVLVIGLIFAVVGTFDLYVTALNALALSNGEAAPLGPVAMTIFWVVRGAVNSILLAVLMYAVHSTVLDDCSSWAVFAGDGKSKLKKLAFRIVTALMVLFLVALLFQVVLALMGFKAGDRIEGGAGVIVMGVATFFAISFGILSVWFITWPASAIWSDNATLRQAFYRGKKVFWYVLGRNVMVLPVMAVLQLVIAAIFLPVVTAVFGAKDQADVASKFFFPGFAFSISALNSVLFVLWFVVLSVIISRALKLGDVRLQNAQA